MLIAEALLLQITRPDGGIVTGLGQFLDVGLAGALLSDLALEGRLTIGPNDRIEISDRTPTGNPHLDSALATLEKYQGKKPKDVLKRLTKDLRQNLYAGLARDGWVQPQEVKRMGLFATTHWVPQRAAEVDVQRRSITDVLGGRMTPDRLTGGVISMVVALGGVQKLWGGLDGWSRGELKRRAREVAAATWASDATNKAIADVQAGVVAAITASTAVVTM